MSYKRVKDGIYYSDKQGRAMEHRGYVTRIYWNRDMLDYLRRHFATTLNVELAGCLGVSLRTMIRKARELGLKKDEVWLSEVWEERRKMAQSASRRKGYPGSFKNGVRNNPDGEFKKGHGESNEVKARRSASLRRWYVLHSKEAEARIAKAWETRRRKMKADSQTNTQGEQ